MRMADTLAELAVQDYADPDAQATITDFVDYTEFLPSDLIRSLSLISSLDQAYQQDTQTIHELTKTYGFLPTLPAHERPEPQTLRKQISESLDHAIRCRESTFAEATRLCDSAARLYDRLAGIKKKLQAMPQPPSRDPTPGPPSRSPTLNRTKRTDLGRTSYYGYYANAHASSGGQRARGRPKKLSNTIITPGQVLPPLELGSPGSIETSDEDSEDFDTPFSGRTPPAGHRKEKYATQKTHRAPKAEKIKVAKIPKARMPGAMGTNVHSVVAGISTSNAIALLEKPPDDAKLGSRHLPWLKLTEYEMAMLRKKMKKNAIWHPSSTMVRRELANRGRGIENYKKAKLLAEEAGEVFIDEDPVLMGSTALAPGEMTLSAAELSITNRGMKLNEAKKLKRENLMKEQAARDAMEIEETGRKIAYASEFLTNLFNPGLPPRSPELPKTLKKRKRDGIKDVDTTPANTPQPSKKIKLPLATTTAISGAGLTLSRPSETLAGTSRERPTTLRLTHTAPAKVMTKDVSSESDSTPTQQSEPQPSRPSHGLRIKLKPPASAEPRSRRASLRDSSSSSSNLSSPKEINPPIRVASLVKRSKRPDPVLAEATSSKTAAPTKIRTETLNPAIPDDMDPDEPRYCLCGGISWGDMVACDNLRCKREWFHWGCVGLTESPGRREKWYCLDCQKSLGVDVQGNIVNKHKARR